MLRSSAQSHPRSARGDSAAMAERFWVQAMFVMVP